MEQVSIDLLEFEEETINILGRQDLLACTPNVGYALGFTLQNKSETADQEGVYEIQRYIVDSSNYVPDRDNFAVMYRFMNAASSTLPASAATLAASKLDILVCGADPSAWIKGLAEGYVNNEIIDSFQLEPLMKFLERVDRRIRVDGDRVRFSEDVTLHRTQFLTLISVAYSAIERGVVADGKKPEEMQKFLEDYFCTLNGSGGFDSMDEISEKVISMNLLGDLADKTKSEKLTSVSNTLLGLYTKTANRNHHFRDDAKDLFADLEKVLRRCGKNGSDGLNLYSAGPARELVMRSLMADNEIWFERLRAKKKGVPDGLRLRRLEPRLADFFRMFDSMDYQADGQLKAQMSNRLLDVLLAFMHRLKSAKAADIDPIIAHLAPSVDLADKLKTAGTGRLLLKNYVIKHRRDMICHLGRKDRGRLISDDLGL